jgi:hypothetical protein
MVPDRQGAISKGCSGFPNLTVHGRRSAGVLSADHPAENAVPFFAGGNILGRHHVHGDGLEGTLGVEAGMGRFEIIDLVCVVDACTHGGTGRFVSMAKAVEELRVLTGDFVSPDETVANALSTVALERGCAVLFDEQAGADILRTP